MKFEAPFVHTSYEQWQANRDKPGRADDQEYTSEKQWLRALCGVAENIL